MPIADLQRQTITEDPPNRETPLPALLEQFTPNDLFYIRSNFSVPPIDLATHRVAVSGRVNAEQSFSLAELKALGTATEIATFECAGNARLSMDPVPAGTAWGWGAASTARFTGVPLRHVLNAAGPNDDVVEIAFEGADHGTLDDGRNIHFERSLPLETALRPDVLLAWQMNGEPLPAENGAPLRLVVPGWYGVASVKWVTHIRALNTPLEAHFQTERYVYSGEQGLADGTPVRRMRVRSLIAQPTDGEALSGAQTTKIAGVAWSGEGEVSAVEVSVDGGETWQPAILGDPPGEGVSRLWHISWTPNQTGSVSILARAQDTAGNRQPRDPVWNELGYGNNLIHEIRVEIR